MARTFRAFAVLTASLAAFSGGFRQASAAPEAAQEWNTFLGSGAADYGAGVARDANGNTFVVGSANASFGLPLRTYTAGSDAFVAKLGPDGTRLWLTFLGGSADDFGRGITLDAIGNVYVTGHSSGTWGLPQIAYSGLDDAFVAKLDRNTGALAWNTFAGSADADDWGQSIRVVDGQIPFVYVAGFAGASWGAPVRAHSANIDAFVSRYNANTGAKSWHTFLGGTGPDLGHGITTDADGNVFVTGETSLASWGTPVRQFVGGFDADAFVARLNPGTGALVWNTFLGGTMIDSAAGIAADRGGNLFVGGYSGGSWGNPVQAFATNPMGPNFDTSVAKLSADTGVLAWNTFMGSATDDDLNYGGIAIDAHGGVYAAGESYGTWGSPLNPFAAVTDIFIARLEASTGVRTWNTFLGGDGSQGAYSLVSDPLGDLTLAGVATATWGNPVNAYGGGGTDAFVARLTPGLLFRDGYEDP